MYILKQKSAHPILLFRPKHNEEDEKDGETQNVKQGNFVMLTYYENIDLFESYSFYIHINFFFLLSLFFFFF